MVDPVSSSSSQSAAAATGSAKKMGQQDFLLLLVTQLRQQDPMKPMDNTEFVSQLAQFSSLEQLSGMSKGMDTLATKLDAMGSYGALGLIGKEVMANSATLSWDGTNPVTAGFGAEKAVSDCKVTIYDQSGNAARTISLGDVTAGAKTFSWDGKGDNGAVLKAGSYKFDASGTGADGKVWTTNGYIGGTVGGVTYENGSPLLYVGGNLVPMSDVISVQGAAAAAGI
ncbi:MAG TPA: flagellar hook capping FlgD N-terminal domain-containing protein [Nitrospirota bacterium]